MMQKEYLTDLEHKKRLAIFPLNPKHENLWKLYKKQQSIIWNREEIKFVQDTNDFKLLDKDVQEFVKRIITFFSGFDTLVNFNIAENLSEITILEARFCFAIQTYIENVHNETYSAMIEAIVPNKKERDDIIASWKDKKSPIWPLVELANKWKSSTNSLGEHIVAFAFIEGVLFSGAFAAIEWLRVKGKELDSKKGKQFMQGLCHSNEFIARDEGLHVRTAVELYSLLTNKISEEKMLLIGKEFTEAAKKFMTGALPDKLIGLSKSSFCSHIEHCANRLLEMFECKTKLYKNALPLDFMDTFGLVSKTNFFERISTDYQNNIFDKNEILENDNGEIIISDDF